MNLFLFEANNFCNGCEVKSISFIDIIISTILFLINLYIIFLICKNYKLKIKYIFVFYLYHIGISILYLQYAFIYQGDVLDYYEKSSNVINSFKGLGFTYSLQHILGTDFLILILSFFKDYFYLELLSLNIIFNFIGFLGLLYTYLIIRSITYNNNYLVKFFNLLFLCLPSIHWWTSSIGKDVIIYFCLSLIGWNFVNKSLYKKSTLAVLILIFLIRPHLLLVILIAFYIYKLITISNSNNKENFVLIGLIPLFTYISFYFILPNLKLNLSIEDLNFNNIYLIVSNYIELKSSIFSTTGSYFYYDNFFLHIFAYLFFPLFSFQTIFYSIVSFENIFLISVFISSIIFINFNFRKEEKNYLIFFLIFFIIFIMLFPNATYNLGVASRQKWMVIPYMYFFIIMIIDRYKHIDLK